MKFANIDEAIMEAAKKGVKPAPKAVPQKKAGKKAPVAPVKKPSPKKAELPKGKKAPPKKTVPTAPTKKPAPSVEKTEPAKTPEPQAPAAKAPEPTPAPAAKSEPASSGERPKFAPRWLEKNRGIGDRLKSAWKSFKASAGQDLGKAGTSYKSVFHEAQQLMKEYQMIESMLQEQALYEGLSGNQGKLDVAPPFGDLTAADFAELRSRKDAIREALAAQMVREEVYFHRTNLAELNDNQRVALMETVKSRCDEMFTRLMSEGSGEVEEEDVEERYSLEEWMGALQEAGYDTADIDEGKLGRLAAGLGLAGAAMMGGAKDAGAQGVVSPQDSARMVTTARTQGGPDAAAGFAKRIGDINAAGRAAGDSVQTGNSPDMQRAVDKANFELDRKKISRQGARQTIVRNPDGTYSATVDVRQRPTQTGAPQMENKYTLEEWMGALEESGVNLNELSPELLGRYTTGVSGQLRDLEHRQERGTAGDNEINATIKKRGRGLTNVHASLDRRQQNPVGRNALEKAKDMDNTARNKGEIDKTLGTIRAKYNNIRATQQAKTATTAESYTLEEWMGALEESGVNLNELSPELRDKVFRTRQAQAAREDNKLPQLYQDLKTATVKGDAWRATLPPEQRGRGIYGNQEDAAKAIQTAHNAKIGLGRKASKTFYGGKEGDKLVDKNPSPSSPSSAEIARAPSLSRATQRTIKNASKMEESINENTVSRLQQLAGITPKE